MTPGSVGPLSRRVGVDRLPPEGAEVTVEAGPEEREALARDFGLPAIHALAGRYRITGTGGRLRVAGRVSASITQICVVTLEPFDSVVDEEVAVDFAAPGPDTEAPGPAPDEDPPDAIVGGRIDLGSLTAEFLALGLDPYPRKPGVVFDDGSGDERTGDSPFAALRPRKPTG